MAHTEGLSPEEIRKAKVKNILKVTAILSAVTAVEFAFALGWPDGTSRTFLNALFLILTVVKAYFIMGEFMHLGHEVKSLIQSVLIPLVFLVWLVIALMYEGSAVLDARGAMDDAESMVRYLPILLG